MHVYSEYLFCYLCSSGITIDSGIFSLTIGPVEGGSKLCNKPPNNTRDSQREGGAP